MSTVLKAAAASPRVSNYYEAVARCMVSVAKDVSERHSHIFMEVFSEWGILKSGQTSALSSSTKSWSDIVIRLNRKDSAVKTKGGAFVSMRRNMSMKASELPSISNLSVYPEIEFEVPFDSYYEFDSSGNLIAEIAPDKDSIIRDANECMSQVYEEIGSNGMWELVDGKVSRRFFN